MQRIPEPQPKYKSTNHAKSYNNIANRLKWLNDAFVVNALNIGVTYVKILDIGTGPGFIPIDIAQRNLDFTIYATDESKAMLTIAENNIKDASIEGIILQQADALELPFGNNYFDLVISNSTLHHIDKPSQFFKEAYRVMKQDGAMFLSDLRRPVNQEELEELLNIMTTPDYTKEEFAEVENSLKAAYSPQEVQDILKKSGINNAEIKLYFRTHLSVAVKSIRDSPLNLKLKEEQDKTLNQLKKEFINGMLF